MSGPLVLSLEEIVRHVRRQRRLLGLTQSALAAAAGTSQSLIAKLEQGRLNPTYETVRHLMDALDRLQRSEEPCAADLMHKDPECAGPDEMLALVLTRMKNQGFSQMPVLDGGRPVGALSERLLLELMEQGEDLEALKQRKVGELMRGSFPTVTPDASRRTVVELLRENEAVLVMDQGAAVGVVTKSDLW